MAGVQDAELAIAVSNAGGLGSLPAAQLSIETLNSELEKLTNSGLHYNLNFFCHRELPLTEVAEAIWYQTLEKYYEEFDVEKPTSTITRSPFNEAMLEVVERYKPSVVSFHFGLPERALLDRVLATGAMVISSATTLREAKWLETQGIHGIIAQGLDAGGHRGHFLDIDPAMQSNTFDLLAELVTEIDLPIIAAGGIASAADVKQALDLGASAVQVGTAFMLAGEAKTSRIHRDALLDASAETALTNLFSGGLARGIKNRLMAELGDLNEAAPAFPHASTALLPLRTAAEKSGLLDFSPVWSGTSREGLAEGSAQEILERLVVELRGKFV